jgi:glycine C-acetyltransferase
MYPVIPKGQMLLRLIPTAAHTERDIRETLDAFSTVSKKLRDGEYATELPVNVPMA